ncbi:right-handed parallel beta-helix repeat-containing protein [Saprospiraceae bacterium]|nr:right-handed parallel beta-helix repeat-containing protein [Saprospiraceae bacterium]
MNNNNRLYLVILVLFFAFQVDAEVFMVNSQQEFDTAHDNAAEGDSILWEDGTYMHIFMEIKNPGLYIAAENIGMAIFSGGSSVRIFSDNITLHGVQFIDGDIGSDDVINTSGSYNYFSEINIHGYDSYKYLVIREECQYNTVIHCNFENRVNLDDKNILSILVSASQPGYHKIQYCSFKNFAGSGNDLGIEPIRIGLSTQADRNSRSVVEYCFFTECDGDGEIISSKASQNVYRHNTFANNSKAELVLRHGSEAIVYGNFFLNGKGGVRVREGQDHYIYNNYFYNIDDRPIYLQNEASDPLDNINIAFNTIINSGELRLGGSGSNPPANVTFANNIFTNPTGALFEQATGTETWILNIGSGDFGIPAPSTGLVNVSPVLFENSAGFYQLSESSPAIESAQSGYSNLPQFEGIDDIDIEILFDIMKQERAVLPFARDLGCSEYSDTIIVQPMATEANTGTSYDSSIASSIFPQKASSDIRLQVFPNPLVQDFLVKFELQEAAIVAISLLDLQGVKMDSFHSRFLTSGEHVKSFSIGDIPRGVYFIQLSTFDSSGKLMKEAVRQIVKN